MVKRRYCRQDHHNIIVVIDFIVSNRYYDPEICRFINADISDVLTTDFENFTQYNLFAYCFNNPTNMSDETGTLPKWVKIAIGAVALAGAVALTVATGGSAAVAAIGVVRKIDKLRRISTQYRGTQNTVVLNKIGKVISCWAKNSKYWRI